MDVSYTICYSSSITEIGLSPGPIGARRLVRGDYGDAGLAIAIPRQGTCSRVQRTSLSGVNPRKALYMACPTAIEKVGRRDPPPLVGILV